MQGCQPPPFVPPTHISFLLRDSIREATFLWFPALKLFLLWKHMIISDLFCSRLRSIIRLLEKSELFEDLIEREYEVQSVDNQVLCKQMLRYEHSLVCLSSNL